jgi:hypothetical protein
MHPPAELVHYIVDSRCSVIVTTANYAARVAEALETAATQGARVALSHCNRA